MVFPALLLFGQALKMPLLPMSRQEQEKGLKRIKINLNRQGTATIL
jgi:hypothetical protein